MDFGAAVTDGVVDGNITPVEINYPIIVTSVSHHHHYFSITLFARCDVINKFANNMTCGRTSL